jgi:hypothetical protein
MVPWPVPLPLRVKIAGAEDTTGTEICVMGPEELPISKVVFRRPSIPKETAALV